MTDEVFSVGGVREPVEILLDEWGVAHIYAASDTDVYFAQGFNAARQRLFQIDLWRRRGLGLLSEVFGPECLEQDRATRLFLYRGDMDVEWRAYGEGTERVATAFVAGVNAYVDACLEGREPMPEEFRILGYAPAKWAPEDVARIRSHGLYHNVEQEVARARAMAGHGEGVEDLRRRREPERAVTVPEGLDLSAVPADVLKVYRLATSPPIVPGGGPAGTTEGQGSNNWALSGGRTATGRPILANDPHRAVGLPSLRYLVHLNAPGMDVIGGGEPSLPGVSIGHNGTVAFGLTIFAIDQEDLYVYETDPRNPSHYRYGDGWEPMTVVREDVPVPGGSTRVELRFTRHGPVVHEDPDRHLAFAVRAAWLEPGMAPYLGSVSYMGARSWEEFLEAMDGWGAPGENQVFADTEGNIGWAPGGKVPVRPNWDGLLPVPGDGRYEWDGFMDARLLPRTYNPDTGWVASANQMNLPPDYPNDSRTVSYDWYPSSRYDRIAGVLEGNDRMTVADCVALQTDYVSLPAREILAAISHLEPEPGEEPGGLALLRGWDGDESAGSGAAALFEIWYRRHFRPALLREAVARLVPEDAVDDALRVVLPDEDLGSDSRVDLMLLRDPERHLGPGARERIDAIVLATLRDADKEVRDLLGPDVSAWRWGDLHHSRLTHPLIAVLGDTPPDWAAVGPLPRGGSGDTVGQAPYDKGFRQTTGATFRVVIDVGEWDSSVAMNSPGQSGRPGDPHYADLFAGWAEDRAFPLLYSRNKVEAHLSSRYRLVPR
ncbi:MAG TPA: penicillin acylase family protein [Actinomadura sp.]|nr:penicillin acylase family protein [Actinomadura sp.]